MTLSKHRVAKKSRDQDAGYHTRRVTTWTNWMLALLTVPGVGLLWLFTFGAIINTARCTNYPCPHHGPNQFFLAVLIFVAPVVALLTIAISSRTATHRRGLLVPLTGWAVLAFIVTVLAAINNL